MFQFNRLKADSVFGAGNFLNFHSQYLVHTSTFTQNFYREESLSVYYMYVFNRGGVWNKLLLFLFFSVNLELIYDLWVPNIFIYNLKTFKVIYVLSKLAGLWINSKKEIYYR